jgi:hypothetical protein
LRNINPSSACDAGASWCSSKTVDMNREGLEPDREVNASTRLQATHRGQ